MSKDLGQSCLCVYFYSYFE